MENGNYCNVKLLSIKEYNNSDNIDWLGFDKQHGNFMYGVHYVTESPLTVTIKRLSVFKNTVEDYKHIVLEEFPDEEYIAPRFSAALSSHGKIGIIRCDYLVTTTSFMFCIIDIRTGGNKIYTIEKGHNLCQEDYVGALFCTDDDNWLLDVNHEESNEIVKYYRLVLNDETNQGELVFVTQNLCQENNDDSYHICKNEMFFNHSLVVFGQTQCFRGDWTEEYSLTQIRVFNFRDNNWTTILTTQDPSMDQSKSPYKIFGRSWDNLYAISLDNEFVFKYYQIDKMWRRTNAKFGKFQGIDKAYIGAINSVYLNQSNYLFIGVSTETAYNRFYLFKIFTVLSLKDLCVFKLFDTFGSEVKRKILPLLPTVLRETHFGMTNTSLKQS